LLALVLVGLLTLGGVRERFPNAALPGANGADRHPCVWALGLVVRPGGSRHLLLLRRGPIHTYPAIAYPQEDAWDIKVVGDTPYWAAAVAVGGSLKDTLLKCSISKDRSSDPAPQE